MKLVALTVEDIENLDVDPMTKNNCQRIMRAANHLGLQLVVAACDHHRHFCLGWQDESCAPGVYKTTLPLVEYQSPLQLTASILEVATCTFDQANRAASGLSDAAERRLAAMERQISALEQRQKLEDMQSSINRAQQIQEEKRQKLDAELNAIVKELNQRALKILGSVSYVEGSSTVRYYRWRSMLKQTLPDKFKIRMRHDHLNFILPRDKEEIYEIIAYDEELFPKMLDQYEQRKQQKEATKKAPE